MNRPKTITNGDAGRIIHWLDHRFKIIFNLAVQSGLRISDILNLRVKDLYNPMTVYEKKSKRKRTFAITNELYNQLLFLADLKSGDDFVFESHHKRAVSVHRSTVHRHIKKALLWSKIDCSAHSARKLYAQNVFEETGSVEKVQKALNHHKLTTTMTYLRNVQQDGISSHKDSTEYAKISIFSRLFSFIKKIFRKDK